MSDRQMLGEVWCAFGHADDGRLIALPEYAAANARAVGDKILEGARREGFKGSLRERMDELGWSVMQLHLHAAEDEPDALRYQWLVENAVIQTDHFRHDGKDPASTKQPLDNAIDAALATPSEPSSESEQLAE
jgi:hypothetical protein